MSSNEITELILVWYFYSFQLNQSITHIKGDLEKPSRHKSRCDLHL